MLVLEERGTGVTGEILSVQSRLTPHMTPHLGIEPGPHWLEARAIMVLIQPLSTRLIKPNFTLPSIQHRSFFRNYKSVPYF